VRGDGGEGHVPDSLQVPNDLPRGEPPLRRHDLRHVRVGARQVRVEEGLQLGELGIGLEHVDSLTA
jgi:hypothetical protein